MTELDTAFMDQNLAQLAHIKLTNTRQGKLSLVEFLQQFELNAEQAGYSPHDPLGDYDAFLIELLEDNVNSEITSQIYIGGTVVPDKYVDFKKRLVQIDGNLQRAKIRQQRQSTTTAQKPKVIQVARRTPTMEGIVSTSGSAEHMDPQSEVLTSLAAKLIFGGRRVLIDYFTQIGTAA
uniref:Retrotransposon gag domain-containing protein n=1 Tax=Mycena chlorophos TaxID=658473 RepID=A0ABQ0L8I5_MYCCL|nr:predicted protein [Mycena chlorophos]